jgi:hypothetical protein
MGFFTKPMSPKCQTYEIKIEWFNFSFFKTQTNIKNKNLKQFGFFLFNLKSTLLEKYEIPTEFRDEICFLSNTDEIRDKKNVIRDQT